MIIIVIIVNILWLYKRRSLCYVLRENEDTVMSSSLHPTVVSYYNVFMLLAIRKRRYGNAIQDENIINALMVDWKRFFSLLDL